MVAQRRASSAMPPKQGPNATGATTTTPPAPLIVQNLVERLGRIEEGISRTRAFNKAGHTSSDASASSTPQSSGPVQPAVPSIHNRTCPTWQRRGLGLVSPPSSRLTNAVLGQIYFGGQNLGTICSRNGIPHLTALGEQWIYSRTGQRPSFQSLDDGDTHGTDQPASHSPPLLLSYQISPGQKTELPEKWVVQSLLRAFLCSDFRLMFPLVDRVLFEETIQLAYGPQSTLQPLEHISAKACVFAFLSLASSHFPDNEAVGHVDCDAFAEAAQTLQSDFLEDTSITTLQTIFMLLLHETLCGRLQAGSMYHAIACRIVFALGGHVLLVSPKLEGLSVEERENRHLRMLFWLCYLFDKDIALRTGQPPIISDEFCDLTLPEGYAENRFVINVSGSDDRPSVAPYDDFQMPWLPSDLRLSLLKSKACYALYSAASLRKSDAELLRTIRELDEELESWRVSIPAEFSPALSVSKHTRPGADTNKSRSLLHVELHLDYHYLLNVIHCASGRCMVDWTGGPGTEKTFGVQSSLELSVEASRSTLVYLSAEAHRLAGEAFWIFIFYPVSALMTLFFNILRNPLDDQAILDVELLSAASELIRSMPIRRVTPHETAYLRKADEFVAELSRLGKCAIAKSQSECDERD
ncbi:putative transcriptional regulatory protein [Tolypocladium ophioglossoides CBS 100239]|uniref:Putative transcriptional regulatory protein n=1 Tax=Tolypocladium ophioglossoides (strain CBS 100239) TaxID=1163406 RepID=A0A0L0N0D4_TOLOC|nr:putative transcriptional regulatory protein [Tolypocladium ophioglossoides CBS 100239]